MKLCSRRCVSPTWALFRGFLFQEIWVLLPPPGYTSLTKHLPGTCVQPSSVDTFPASPKVLLVGFASGIRVLLTIACSCELDSKSHPQIPPSPVRPQFSLTLLLKPIRILNGNYTLFPDGLVFCCRMSINVQVPNIIIHQAPT